MMDGTEILDIPLPDDDAFTKFILHYKLLMSLYESAIRCAAMRLDIMEKEADTSRSLRACLPTGIPAPKGEAKM